MSIQTAAMRSSGDFAPSSSRGTGWPARRTTVVITRPAPTEAIATADTWHYRWWMRPVSIAAAIAFTLSSVAHGQTVTRTAGRITITADLADAFPGGMVTVTARSRRPIRGIAYAILDGRRCPAFSAPDGLRALVPIPVTHWPGPATLGVEIRTVRGRQRIPLPIAIEERVYSAGSRVLPEVKRAMLTLPGSVRDGRALLLHLRTLTPILHGRGPFLPPVDAPAAPSFGGRQTYAGGADVEARTDAIHGEYHRGLDYAVAVGTPVHAPAAAVVQFAGPLTLSGETVILDHGQGLLSAFFHLSRADVRAGELVLAREVVGLSGESGIAPEPHLHWAVYLHGVAVDPRVTERLH